jgi:hypothetical protein
VRLWKQPDVAAKVGEDFDWYINISGTIIGMNNDILERSALLTQLAKANTGSRMIIITGSSMLFQYVHNYMLDPDYTVTGYEVENIQKEFIHYQITHPYNAKKAEEKAEKERRRCWYRLYFACILLLVLIGVLVITVLVEKYKT